MRIDHPIPEPYLVDDYDFSFTNGLSMSFSVAKDLGDTVDFDTSPMAVQFHFTGKPTSSDPDVHLPDEDVTILMQHVLLVSHRSRKVTPPSLEERDLFKQTLQQLSKTVQ